MKKLLQVIVLLLLFSIEGKSQVWNQTNAQWAFNFSSPTTYGYVILTNGSDTIINGIACKNINVNGVRANYFYPITDTINEIAPYHIYENDSVVYAAGLFFQSLDFDTLYNFKATPGENWTIKQSTWAGCDSLLNITVVDTGHAMISGINLYFLSVEYSSPQIQGNDTLIFSDTDTIYERFGSLKYFASFRSLPDYCASGLLDFEYFTLCGYTDDEISFENNCISIYVGIDEKVKDIVSLFPNPVINFLNIELQDNLEKSEIRIQDLNGQKVYISKIINQKSEIDISSFANGIYVLTVFNAEKTVTMKMVVQH